MTTKGPGDRSRESLSAEALKRLLSALSPDPEHEGDQYDRIRTKLTFFFESRRCRFSSELVDATLDRAARKLLEPGIEEIRDIRAFIYGIANFILLESYRAPERKTLSLEDTFIEPIVGAVDDDAVRRDQMHDALASCLERLSSNDGILIRRYYQGEKSEKKEGRMELAASLGISMGALAMRTFYIRKKLRACVDDRLNGSSTV